MSDIDDLIEQMKRDELEDASKLKPIQYAKLRGIYPQRVYKAIRDRKLEVETCLCGSKVIDIAQADGVFKIGTAKQGTIVLTSLQEEEEVPGGDVDSDDEQRDID